MNFVDAQNIARLGVNVHHMNQFIGSCGGRSAITKKSIEEVCKNHIIPMTSASKSSYCEMLAKSNNPADQAAVGNATVFVCHAWKYVFLEVVDALLYHFRDQSDVFIWFDVFNYNQHGGEMEKGWWSSSLPWVIGEIGYTVMVWTAWNHAIPLSRTWCLYELYCSIMGNAKKLEIVMNGEQERHWYENMSEIGESVMNQILGGINIEKSECSNTKEKEIMLEVMKEKLAGQSFDKVNETIIYSLRSWMISSVVKEIAREEKLPNGDDFKVAALQKVTAQMYSFQCKYPEAITYYQKAFSIMKSYLGENHSDTMELMFQLGQTHQKAENFVEAEKYFQTCFERSSKMHGLYHPQTLVYKNYYDAVLNKDIIRNASNNSMYAITTAATNSTQSSMNSLTKGLDSMVTQMVDTLVEEEEEEVMVEETIVEEVITTQEVIVTEEIVDENGVVLSKTVTSSATSSKKLLEEHHSHHEVHHNHSERTMVNTMHGNSAVNFLTNGTTSSSSTTNVLTTSTKNTAAKDENSSSSSSEGTTASVVILDENRPVGVEIVATSSGSVPQPYQFASEVIKREVEDDDMSIESSASLHDNSQTHMIEVDIPDELQEGTDSDRHRGHHGHHHHNIHGDVDEESSCISTQEGVHSIRLDDIESELFGNRVEVLAVEEEIPQAETILNEESQLDDEKDPMQEDISRIISSAAHEQTMLLDATSTRMSQENVKSTTTTTTTTTTTSTIVIEDDVDTVVNKAATPAIIISSSRPTSVASTAPIIISPTAKPVTTVPFTEDKEEIEEEVGVINSDEKMLQSYSHSMGAMVATTDTFSSVAIAQRVDGKTLPPTAPNSRPVPLQRENSYILHNINNLSSVSIGSNDMLPPGPGVDVSNNPTPIEDLQSSASPTLVEGGISLAKVEKEHIVEMLLQPDNKEISVNTTRSSKKNEAEERKENVARSSTIMNISPPSIAPDVKLVKEKEHNTTVAASSAASSISEKIKLFTTTAPSIASPLSPPGPISRKFSITANRNNLTKQSSVNQSQQEVSNLNASSVSSSSTSFLAEGDTQGSNSIGDKIKRFGGGISPKNNATVTVEGGARRGSLVSSAMNVFEKKGNNTPTNGTLNKPISPKPTSTWGMKQTTTSEASNAASTATSNVSSSSSTQSQSQQQTLGVKRMSSSKAIAAAMSGGNNNNIIVPVTAAGHESTGSAGAAVKWSTLRRAIGQETNTSTTTTAATATTNTNNNTNTTSNVPGKLPGSVLNRYDPTGGNKPTQPLSPTTTITQKNVGRPLPNLPGSSPIVTTTTSVTTAHPVHTPVPSPSKPISSSSSSSSAHPTTTSTAAAAHVTLHPTPVSDHTPTPHAPYAFQYIRMDLLNNLAVDLRQEACCGKAKTDPSSLTAEEKSEKLTTALEILQEVYRDKQSLFGKEHVSTLNTLNNLGNVYYSLTQYTQSEQCHKECYELRRKVLGDNAPETWQSLHNLGSVYRRLNKFLDSESYYKKALRKRKEVLGVDHWTTKHTQTDLVHLQDSLVRKSPMKTQSDFY